MKTCTTSGGITLNVPDSATDELCRNLFECHSVSDKDKLKALLTGFGVVFKEEASCVIVVEAGDGPKNNGYNGLFTDFTFNAAGK